MMVVDHVVLVAPDAAEAARELRERHGLGSERGPYHPFAGTRNHTVPLEPPAYLEFLTIENRDAAERTETGRRVLECEAAGFGLLGWAVLVDDLDDVSARLGIDIFDYTIEHGDGTLRGWRAVSGPPHLPFFIDYPNNGDRRGRLQAMYDRVGHTCSPRAFTEVTSPAARVSYATGSGRTTCRCGSWAVSRASAERGSRLRTPTS